MPLSKRAESILLLIWTQALIATIGSLYLSEIVGYNPCELCWFQRVLMYPLVIIYGVAILRKDMNIALPGIVLSGIGFLVSVYHYGLQKLPFFNKIGDFCGNVPCNVQYINYFGFITIPFLAGLAFMIIIILHVYLLKKQKS